MKQTVKINVIGVVDQQDKSDETIDFTTIGQWYNKNDKDYILYDDYEIVENQLTKTRITIDQNVISIKRTGASNNHLVFEAGISHKIPYETPYGVLELMSTTDEIVINRHDQSLEIKVTYRLEMDQMDMGTNVFHLKANVM